MAVKIKLLQIRDKGGTRIQYGPPEQFALSLYGYFLAAPETDDGSIIRTYEKFTLTKPDGSSTVVGETYDQAEPHVTWLHSSYTVSLTTLGRYRVDFRVYTESKSQLLASDYIEFYIVTPAQEPPPTGGDIGTLLTSIMPLILLMMVMMMLMPMLKGMGEGFKEIK